MYDFAVDSDKIFEFTNKLSDKVLVIEEQIGIIINGIAGLQEAWDGSSYQTFKAKCEEFYPAMHSLPFVLRAYSSLFYSNVANAELELTEKISAAVSFSN